ncbi:Retaining alpha-galactosidase precursor [Planctomycetes bacterium MalM25]|nr:Retaining alpha-galactosidase precursor [Planctomycetes bacterium MalM25]
MSYRATLALTTILAIALGTPSLAADAATRPRHVAKPGQASWVKTIHSPNGLLSLQVRLGGDANSKGIQYSLERGGQPVVAESSLGFELISGATVGKGLSPSGPPQTGNHRGDWAPVYGEQERVQLSANTLRASAFDEETGLSVEFEFRCYNEGLAFRSHLQTDSGKTIEVQRELSEFRLSGEAVCWSTTNAQGLYRECLIDEMPKGTERPLVSKLADRTYLAITEAAQVGYPRALLSQHAEGGNCLVTDLDGPATAKQQLTTPWRVVLVGESPGELLESNQVILDLNQPCRIAEASWIRPGKVLREITLTTAGAEASIDFAVKNNFQFVEFDAGWYGHEYDDESDATTITVDPKRTPGPLDLRRLIREANQRGVGVILYVNRRALHKQLDEILPLYKEWGVSGVKYGFVHVGSQEATEWLHEAVEKAAKHGLMVDVHDEYRPTGFSRTFPNLMTQEGVRGDEASPSSEQTLISLFTRGIAGASDFTVCYFAERVEEKWTHGHQLAKPICFYSPWQFIYWYDTPLADHVRPPGDHKAVIIDTPDQELFRRLPTTWDETRVLEGEIGEYAVIARRSGEDWFLGVMNASEPRTLQVPLDFLHGEATYDTMTFTDDPSIQTPTRVRVDERRCQRAQTLRLNLLPNGGFAAHFTPSTSSGQVAKVASGRESEKDL